MKVTGHGEEGRKLQSEVYPQRILVEPGRYADENKEIKEGKTPEEWKKPENAAKIRQKDTDARWTKKNNETHYGYKDHVKVDRDSKIIVEFTVTDAAVHDSREIVELVIRRIKKSMPTVRMSERRCTEKSKKRTRKYNCKSTKKAIGIAH